VAVFALLILRALSPLMRGGNRQVALIALEGIALALLVALLAGSGGIRARPTLRTALLALLATSPLWLALVYLLPVPASLWAATPGRGVYPDLLASAGIAMGDWLPLSLVPDATASSLMAGIPVAAAFLAGLALRLPQLKLALGVLAGVAFLQVVMGLLQMAGGSGSSLYFGGIAGRPFGTFANPNHFANYLAMALAAYVWLAWSSASQWRRRAWSHTASTRTRMLAIWGAGGMLLLVGILMSHSRGAALGGLPAALCAFAVAVTAGSRGRAWRATLAMAGLALLAAVALVGFDFVVNRFQARSFSADASFRELLAASTLHGAAQFWPWGAGWGSYAAVFPRFQPPTVVGTANYAHNDYAQLLFEGGIFALLLAAAFAWLAVTRAVQLVRAALAHGRLRREEMASALCGLGLLGFLLHSLVEFNMHIPANAVAAALLAGAYLRPLAVEEEPAGD
jgi:O-antigen ligase